MQNNPAREALTRAVNKAIENDSPVYTEQKADHGANNAKGWYQSIFDMVTELEKANRDGHTYEAAEKAETRIHESVLSVEVRSGWYVPGSKWNGVNFQDADTKPAHYRILLTYGGPSLQLTGELNEHGEPETARLEYQDWGTPWTLFNPGHHIEGFKPDDYDAYDSTLLAFASCFYYGE
jgi:hypothetical protein